MRRVGPPILRFDLARAQRLLRQGEATSEWLGQWLPRTWEEPEVFREELLIAASTRRNLECKSRPDTGVSLYYDLVLQHVGKRRVALVSFDRGTEVETTFDELHDRSSVLATRWRAAGVEAGQRVALVLPTGLDFAVTFLAALRLGLVPCFLPPQGRGWVRTRLDALQPDWLVAGPKQELLVSDSWPRLDRTASSGDTTFAGSRTWDLEAPALCAFAPFGAEQPEPREVSAGELLLGALRDGWLLLGLEPGERLGVLGFDPLQVQPSLLCAAWAAGAAWVELPAEESAGGTLASLGRSRVSVLGLTAAHRALALEATRGPLRKELRLWFRPIEDVFDFEAWAAFQSELQELKVRGLAWLQGASAGGAHLVSWASGKQPSSAVWPAPGREFQLSTVGGARLPSLTGMGIYTPLEAPTDATTKVPLPRVLLAQQGSGFVWAGSVESGPQGRVVLEDELRRAAELHPAVGGAAVVTTPGRHPNEALVTLLLFVEPGPTAEADREAVSLTQVRELLVREVGAPNLPHRFEIVPLCPRRDPEGRVDAKWARSQYLSGAFHAKASSAMFRALARLGWILGSARSQA